MGVSLVFAWEACVSFELDLSLGTGVCDHPCSAACSASVAEIRDDPKVGQGLINFCETCTGTLRQCVLLAIRRCGAKAETDRTLTYTSTQEGERCSPAYIL